MRVYLPQTVRGLVTLFGTGQLPDVPLPGYGVTAELREWYADGDDEELEYVALTQAAAASVRLLDADPDVVRRRVVVVMESASVEPVPRVDRAAVRVTEPCCVEQVVAVHLDDSAAEADVTAAADAVVAADLGSEDAAFTVEQAQGHELQWYAPQEVPSLLELAGWS